MQTIFDTDFLYNFFIDTQSNHNIALDKMSKIDLDQVFILKLVIYELSTVLSNKESQDIAISTIEVLNSSGIMLYDISKDDEGQIWSIFKSQTKKGISFVDCANLVIAQKYNAKIASFDKFYDKNLLI